MTSAPDNRILGIDHDQLAIALTGAGLAPLVNPLHEAATIHAAAHKHGELPHWQAAVDALPSLKVTEIQLQQRAVSVAGTSNLTPEAFHEQLLTCFQCLRPWRKGPYSIQTLFIDTEWRSDWKWLRLQPHITPLAGRKVLDVGCGSGYHLWRMRGAGAALVLGIDPGLLFNLQFRAIQRYVADPGVMCLPLTMETLPEGSQAFDSVFSMGVLYHRRDPMAHLAELRHALTLGGELILETLVYPHADDVELDLTVSGGRYARMRNLWSLPSPTRVLRWLSEAGFQQARLVSLDCTSTAEQRATRWMNFESLLQALSMDDVSTTIEGVPRPHRAVYVAKAPDR